MSKWIALGFIALIACQAPPVFESDNYKTLFEGGKLTEGPAVDSVGNLYFSDQPNDVIRWIDTTGNVSIFLQPSALTI